MSSFLPIFSHNNVIYELSTLLPHWFHIQMTSYPQIYPLFRKIKRQIAGTFLSNVFLSFLQKRISICPFFSVRTVFSVYFYSSA